jgi:hypothetical protein
MNAQSPESPNWEGFKVILKVTTHMQGIRKLELLLVGVNKIGFRGT